VRPKCKFRERYIGVGYKDKGHLSQPHDDASPGWKLLAMRERSTAKVKVQQVLISNKIKIDWTTTKWVKLHPQKGLGFQPPVLFKLVKIVNKDNKSLGFINIDHTCSRFTDQVRNREIPEEFIAQVSAKLSSKTNYYNGYFIIDN